MNKPVIWKMLLLNWLTIYPLINILFFLLWPLIGELHQLLKTLILTGILVPLLGLIIPFLQNRFKGWLYK